MTKVELKYKDGSFYKFFTQYVAYFHSKNLLVLELSCKAEKLFFHLDDPELKEAIIDGEPLK